MVPTVTRLSAQPAIVKIRRVDALIIPLLISAATTTTTTTRLYAFTALLLLVDERADKYTAIAPSSPCPPPAPILRAAAAALAAAARSPLHSPLFNFSKPARGPLCAHQRPSLSQAPALRMSQSPLPSLSTPS